MIARFFIDRPVLANVIAWIMLVVGAVALARLPVAQYPELTPPTVQVTTSYPGASATTVQQQVARGIEQQVNGVEGMLYMQSTATNDGRYALTVTFATGTDPEQAQAAVQNRVAIALPQLPAEVQQQGVTTKKKSTAILQIVTLSSTDPRHDGLFLANFASLELRDRLARLPGVADVAVFGVGQYGMRVWLDPAQMRARGLNPADVVKVVTAQSQRVSAGQLGGPPAPDGQPLQLTVNIDSGASDPADFGSMVLKTDAGGAVTRLSDVARIELGSQNYGQVFSVDGKAAGGLAIYQQPGANALDTAKAVRAALAAQATAFPAGLAYDVPLDTTTFVKASVDEVYKTLLEAGVLVLLVIVIFLQDWRATLVPATTVPITIVGAFAAFAAMGFSINLLTLFALVLCIGIVVDDAIVIVEGVARHVEAGASPRDAAIATMRELTGPIVGITLVLMSVFLPAAFMPGITGRMYQQFALVIAATAVLSALNAMTLKPTQSAKYIRPHRVPARKNPVYRAFDAGWARLEGAYGRAMARLVARPLVAGAVGAVLIGGAIAGLVRLPTEFIPIEDQGYVLVAVQLPDGASLERTRRAMDELGAASRRVPGVARAIAVAGVSTLDANASLANAGTLYLTLADWKQRGKGQDLRSIVGGMRTAFAGIESARAVVLVPPPINGLGLSGGFQMQLVLEKGNDWRKLQDAAQALAAAARERPEIQQAATSLRAEVPQLTVSFDRARAEMLGVSVGDAQDALQAYLGAAYATQFSKFGQNYAVYVQADQAARVDRDRLGALGVRARDGSMVPLGAFMAVTDTTGPAVVSQYDLLPTAAVNGAAAAGHSSGEAMRAMEETARRVLPDGVGFEWTAMSYQEKLVGNAALVVFGLAILLVYLVLAGQYESWWAPWPVILSVPLALVGTVGALAGVGLPNNLYVQIGLVLLIALSAKNAILVVEVAQERRHEGCSAVDAALQASMQRFRPIVMTSFAFILGVLPLVLSSGPGAAARKSIGITVFSGMLASTLLAVTLVPVFYVLVERLRAWRAARRRRGDGEAPRLPAPEA